MGGRMITHGLDNGDGGGIPANGQLEVGEIDYSTIFCSKFEANLVPNTVTMYGPSNTGVSGDKFVVFKDYLYFNQQDSKLGGNQLWKTNGDSPVLVLSQSVERLTVVGDSLLLLVIILNFGRVTELHGEL